MLNFHLEGLINNEELSDVCFAISDDETAMQCDEENIIWANRAVLAYNSPVFKAMLYGQMREGNKDNKEPIEITDIPYETFYFMMEYMYTGSMRKVEQGMCIPVLYAAKKYQLLNLQQKCIDMFLTNVTCSDVYQFINTLSLDNPWSYQDDIRQLCLEFIELNGDDFLKSEQFSKLPKEIVIDIIKSPILSVTSEMNVFDAIMNWIECYNSRTKSKRKKIKTTDMKKELFPYIRFTNMTVGDILGKVSSYGIFSSDEILDISRYISLELDSLPPSINLNTDLRKPPNIRKYNFRYHRDFDENGVIYFIGYDVYEKKYRNPKNNGDIRICTTSTNTNKMASNIITSRKLKSKGWVGHGTQWDDDVYTWISIDLGPHRKLRLTDYTLFHSWPTPIDSLRSWVIEGCNPCNNLGQRAEERELKEENADNDEVHIYTEYRIGHSFDENHLEWIALDERKDDCSLNNGWSKNTWQAKNNSNAFRMIRLRSTGPDSTGTQYLTIGGIEFYGTLFVYEKIDPMWDY